MAGKRKGSSKVPGQIKMKALHGAYSAEEGMYVESRVRDGVVERPYRISNKVTWMTEPHAGRVEEQITAHNIAAKEANKRGIVTKRQKIRLEEGEDKYKYKTIEVTVQETKKEAQERIMKQKEKLFKKATKEDVTQSTKAFMAKLDTVASGMANVLRTKTPENQLLKKELAELVKKVNKMTPEERIKFYEDNYELFADMSDYYQWLNRHSGKFTSSDSASLRYPGMTVESYVKKNIESVKKLNRKLDDYV